MAAMHSSNSRLALLWLISAFGAVVVARYEARTHPPVAPAIRAPALQAPPREAEALRDGRRLDINRASAAELELLPGVGPSLAQRLVEARTRQGNFRTGEELRKVKGVGAKTLAKLLPYLKFDSEQLEHSAESDLRLSERRELSTLPKPARSHVDTDRPLARSEVVDPEPQVAGRTHAQP